MATLVFLLDVDNTLIANDEAKEDLDRHIRVELGDKLADRFWELYEEARKQEDVVDIPLALKWLREKTPLSELDEETYRHVVSIFDNYPYYEKLYPYELPRRAAGRPAIAATANRTPSAASSAAPPGTPPGDAALSSSSRRRGGRTRPHGSPGSRTR